MKIEMVSFEGKIPNLALMKIRTFHRKKGVVW